MARNTEHENDGGWPPEWYDGGCRRCERLGKYLAQTRSEFGHYFCAPVPPFGDRGAELLVVGLAPGKHGANATGRPFTGDHAGILLYRTLHHFGFSSTPVSESALDGLELRNCRITNAVKCLPPENKPTTLEERNCNSYLVAEIAQPDLKVILALGLLAHRSILRALGLRLSSHRFGHGNVHHLDNGLQLVNSYHCSRYNTQTGRLTEAMFHQVFDRIRQELD